MPREPREPREPLPLPSPPPMVAPADFATRLEAIGVTLDRAQIAALGDFLARLVAMNKLVNLTRITAHADVWTKHALDALTLVPQLAGLPAGARVLDVGSGGGVPGIPLAIARPDLHVTLLEATEKKAAFLRAVIDALGLPHTSVVADRAEKVAETELGASFDVVTARAVGKIEALLPWTVPFARPGGRVLLIKGERAEQELADAAKALRHARCTHEGTVLTPTGRIVVLRVR